MAVAEPLQIATIEYGITPIGTKYDDTEEVVEQMQWLVQNTTSPLYNGTVTCAVVVDSLVVTAGESESDSLLPSSTSVPVDAGSHDVYAAYPLIATTVIVLFFSDKYGHDT
jgi:hypothetical protein